MIYEANLLETFWKKCKKSNTMFEESEVPKIRLIAMYYLFRIIIHGAIRPNQVDISLCICQIISP